MDNGHFKEIVNALVELKNTSELMLSLAYSSLFINSRELAKHVEELEEYIDNLHTKYELLVLSSDFNKKESKDYLGLIRIGIVTEQIADAAASIAEVVLRGIKPHPILKIAIDEAEETVTSLKVPENSPLRGKSLREARVASETGMWILLIRRDQSWIRPRPSTIIQGGDIIVASGYSEGEEAFRKLFCCS